MISTIFLVTAPLSLHFSFSSCKFNNCLILKEVPSMCTSVLLVAYLNWPRSRRFLHWNCLWMLRNVMFYFNGIRKTSQQQRILRDQLYVVTFGVERTFSRKGGRWGDRRLVMERKEIGVDPDTHLLQLPRIRHCSLGGHLSCGSLRRKNLFLFLFFH